MKTSITRTGLSQANAANAAVLGALVLAGLGGYLAAAPFLQSLSSPDFGPSIRPDRGRPHRGKPLLTNTLFTSIRRLIDHAASLNGA